MKFGKQLRLNAIPRWRAHYVAYKLLKQAIRGGPKAEAVEGASAAAPIARDEFVARLVSAMQACNGAFSCGHEAIRPAGASAPVPVAPSPTLWAVVE